MLIYGMIYRKVSERMNDAEKLRETKKSMNMIWLDNPSKESQACYASCFHMEAL